MPSENWDEEYEDEEPGTAIQPYGADEGIQVVGNKVTPYRGDDFDIGQPSRAGTMDDVEVHAVQQPFNTQSLTSQLGLSAEQAENVMALISGAGTAAAVKYLGKLFGPEIAAAIGGALAAHVGKKLMKKG